MDSLPEWLLTFLPKLRCPVTAQPLREATPSECQKHGVARPALVTEDGQHCYPILNGMPHLVVP